MHSQIENKQKMIQKSITREELRELVDEFLANGGKITQCKPGVAYDLRSDNVRRLSKPVVLKRRVAPAVPTVFYKKSA